MLYYQSVVKKGTFPESVLCKKHCAIAYHLAREIIAAKRILSYWERSESNLADFFTKVFSPDKRLCLVPGILSWFHQVYLGYFSICNLCTIDTNMSQDWGEYVKFPNSSCVRNPDMWEILCYESLKRTLHESEFLCLIYLHVSYYVYLWFINLCCDVFKVHDVFLFIGICN